jgi:hypothetical protein
VGGIPVLELLGQDRQPVEELKQAIESDICCITIIEGTGASQYPAGCSTPRQPGGV